MDIKILGTGCAKCKKLEESARQAVQEMDIQATVSKEEDVMKIMEYGVMRTPGLVIDEKVVSSGRVLTAGEIKDIVQGAK